MVQYFMINSLALSSMCFPETPLTLAAHLDMVEMITVLKNGGAHLDFRSRDGMTALHKAVRAKNQNTLKVAQISSYLVCNLSVYEIV